MERSLNTKEISDLCVSCGMCCDGTLFKFAKIFNANDPILAKQLNMDLFNDNEGIAIKLPCPNFNKCCTVYHQNKPTICNHFFCAPLKKYKINELDYENTMKIIVTLKNLRDEIENIFLATQKNTNISWADKLMAIEEIISNEDSNIKQMNGLLIFKYLQFIEAKHVFFS